MCCKFDICLTLCYTNIVLVGLALEPIKESPKSEASTLKHLPWRKVF